MTSTTQMERRSFLQLVGIATSVTAVGGALAACGPASSPSGGGNKSLQINSFGGSFQSNVQKTVISPFQTKYGVTVDVTTALGSAALTRLKSSPKNKPAFDVAFMDLAPILQAKAAGLLQKIDPSKLSNLSNLYPLAVDKNGFWIAELVAMSGIAYNTEKVKTPPTSWQDLWDPKYAGHVAISDISGTIGYQFLVEAARLNGGSETNIDPGFAALKKLKPNIVSMYKTPAEAVQLLTSGEAWLGPAYSDRISAAKKEGAPVAFVQPKEGAIAVLSCMCIPNGTASLDPAHKFIDFMISTPINQSFVTANGEGPTNSKVVLSDNFLNENYVAYGKKVIDSLVALDYEEISRQIGGWTTRWASEIAG